jgi:hypothetical protein
MKNKNIQTPLLGFGFLGLLIVVINQMKVTATAPTSKITMLILGLSLLLILSSLYLKIKKEIDTKTFTIKNYLVAISFIVLTILMFIFQMYFM